MNGKLKIGCFICNWAFSEQQVSTISQENPVPYKAKIARVRCLGRVDPATVLEALEKGIDGILLIGCTPPDCHFVEGSAYAEHMLKLLKKLLNIAGLEPERLDLRLYSPQAESKLKEILNDFAMQLQKCGPSRLAEKMDENLLLTVSAAKNVAAAFRARLLGGREKMLTEGVNVYGERISPEEYERLLNEVLNAELIRYKIYLMARKRPISVREVAASFNTDPAIVLRHVVNLRRRGMLALDHVEGQTPLYRALEV